MLKNMKIKKSLIFGFGLAIAVLVVMSTSLLLLVGNQRRSHTSVIQHEIRANQLITICRMEAETAARNVRDMALRPGDRNNSTLEARANEVLAELKTNLAELESTYPLADRSMLDNYVQAVNDWRNALPSIITAINDGDADHATALIKDTCTPRLETMSDYAAVLGDALTQAQTDVTTSQNRTTIIIEAILITINVIAMLFIISMAFKLINGIVEPTEQVRQALMGFSEGDFSIAVNYESKNELGDMCEALRTSQRILTAAVTDQCRLLEEMARGNFDIRSNDTSVYVGGLKSVLQSVRTINANLSDTLAQIDLSAEQVSAGSEQVSTGAQALAQGATEQASAVQELSATIAEISNSAQKNAANSKSAMEHSLNAAGRVDESSKYMEEMVQAMEDISESSQEIGKIIATIENIAFQTNILALNAAVEAARAGSAGKGFAVVADEVRNLATKSDQAAKATKELIDRSITSVQNGNGIVKKVSESLSRTVEAAEKATGLIQDISKAAEEEAEAIAQVTEGIDQISSVVQTNSATSEQSAAASEELSSQANLMKSLMAKFRLRTAGDGYAPETPAAIPAAASGGESAGSYAGGFSKY